VSAGNIDGVETPRRQAQPDQEAWYEDAATLAATKDTTPGLLQKWVTTPSFEKVSP